MRNRLCIATRIIAFGVAAFPLMFGGCAPEEPGDATGTGGNAGGTTTTTGTGGGTIAGSGGATATGSGGAAGGVDGGTTDGGSSSGGAGPIGSDGGAAGAGAGAGGRAGAGAGTGGRLGGVGSGGAPGTAGTPGTGGRPATGGAIGTAGAGGPVTVFIASDSTASTYAANAANMQAGWGQMLPMYFNTMVRVSNQAIGGRTSRRFINEGRLTTITTAMKPGDYLLVQFGTNDGNTTAVYDDGEPYFVNTTDFQTYMNMYIDAARAKQGIPVLVTAPPRASCTGDSHSFGNGLAGYSAAMKTVATAKTAALVDLNAKTLAYVNMIGCIAAKADFYLLNDGTHFQQNGARLMAGFVADGVVEAGLGLGAYQLP